MLSINLPNILPCAQDPYFTVSGLDAYSNILSGDIYLPVCERKRQNRLEYLEKNKEHISNQQKLYNQKNALHLSQNKQSYYIANRERLLYKSNLRSAQHREDIREAARIRYVLNKDEINRLRQERYAAKKIKKIKDREAQAKSRQRDPDKRKFNALKSLCRKHGISPEIYYQMLEEQRGVCAICKQPETTLHSSGHIQSLSLDHCHSTDVVRGLLCNRCNLMLGHSRDDIDILEKAIAYLKEHNTPPVE